MIAVEPVGKELSPCLKAGERLWSNPPQFLTTIAEGIMTQQAGQLTFPILCQLIEKETIVVPDDVMIQGMKIVAERMKLVNWVFQNRQQKCRKANIEQQFHVVPMGTC